MTDCIFCKIVAKQAPGQILYQDHQATAFRDTHPVGPTHVLVVPNRHIASVNDLVIDDESLIGHLFTIARQIALQEGVDQSGYRLIMNTGPHSGQAVFHLHLHVIGGQRMRFPMG
jgi:histidine triad (HIT) family protein